jgi:hypothetical protein
VTENLHGCTAILPSPQEEVRSQADVAWDALHASLREFLPPCHARDLFTADRLSDEQRAECASICATCPVADLCDAYATAANVPSGFWAGHLYTPKGKQ